ncbi:hypothetical protein MAP00_006212 [Monascus purpureus]|nr:hypothetical protein MAP00_006212 [Monascus purpureus]
MAFPGAEATANKKTKRRARTRARAKARARARARAAAAAAAQAQAQAQTEPPPQTPEEGKDKGEDSKEEDSFDPQTGARLTEEHKPLTRELRHVARASMPPEFADAKKIVREHMQLFLGEIQRMVKLARLMLWLVLFVLLGTVYLYKGCSFLVCCFACVLSSSGVY